MNKMIIAFDAKRLFNNFTGLGNYSRTLVRNLQRYYPEHEYHLFTPKISKNAETDYFLDGEKFIIHTPKFNSPFWKSFGMSAAINNLNPHIFHGLSHEIPFGLRNNIHTMLTFHDLIYEKFPGQFNIWDRWLYRMKYRSSANRAHSIIAISESTKLDLITFYDLNPEKITVVYQSCNPVFQDNFNDESAFHPILSKLEDYYLYVGSIIERKGLLNIIFAYSKLSEAHRKPFVVIGKPEKCYLKKVNSMIRYYGLEEYFYFILHLSNEDLVTAYDKAFILIYPSIYEGFGIPVIESLFRRKPVITSNISSLPEAAGSGAILIDPYNPDHIHEAMLQMHEKDRYAMLSDQGFTYVSDSFSTEKTTNRMLNFYKYVIKNDDSPSEEK